MARSNKSDNNNNKNIHKRTNKTLLIIESNYKNLFVSLNFYDLYYLAFEIPYLSSSLDNKLP